MNYAEKQLKSLSILRFSHSRRFEKAARIAKHFQAHRILDYGCGDGTLLRVLQDSRPNEILELFGCDKDEKQLGQVQTALDQEGRTGYRKTQLLTLSEIPSLEQSLDLVYCTEVLEHCLADEVPGLLHQLWSLLRPGGRAVISVPIEIGPSLVVKQLGRKWAALRGVPHYEHTEVYSWQELFTMVFAGFNTQIQRPAYPLPDLPNQFYHGHKGFNWKSLELKIESQFQLESRSFSPFPFFGPMLNSQVWWICKK